MTSQDVQILRILQEVSPDNADEIAAADRLLRLVDAGGFLSMVTNPDRSRGLAPWSRGVDWTYFVVVDSNVELFLASIGYQGNGTYDARREFVRGMAREIDLTALSPGLHALNPRLVQQAMYLSYTLDVRHVSGDAAVSCRSARAMSVSRRKGVSCQGVSRSVRVWVTVDVLRSGS